MSTVVQDSGTSCFKRILIVVSWLKPGSAALSYVRFEAQDAEKDR